MIVAISVKDGDEQRYIGAVLVQKEIPQQEWEDLYAQWRIKCPVPESDSQFIDWLCEKHSMQAVEVVSVVL